MKKLILASLLASVLVFIWGFVVWAVLGPIVSPFHTVTDEVAVGEALKQYLKSGDGTYFLPNPSKAGDADFAARHRSGPIATIHFQAAGTEPMGGGIFLGGWLHMLLCAFLMGLFLRSLALRLESYGERFRVVAAAGTICAIFANLGRPIWYYQSWLHHGYQTAYEVTSWLIMAAVLAWFIHGNE